MDPSTTVVQVKTGAEHWDLERWNGPSTQTHFVRCLHPPLLSSKQRKRSGSSTQSRKEISEELVGRATRWLAGQNIDWSRSHDTFGAKKTTYPVKMVLAASGWVPSAAKRVGWHVRV